MVIFADFFGFSLSGGGIPEYFYELCRILTFPQARQIQTRSESTRQYYKPMNSLLGYL